MPRDGLLTNLSIVSEDIIFVGLRNVWLLHPRPQHFRVIFPIRHLKFSFRDAAECVSGKNFVVGDDHIRDVSKFRDCK